MGQPVFVPAKPKRIVSLVPSQTELLAALGLDDEVVGITRFCIEPPSWRKTKKIIGGTKRFNVEEISILNPDLILGNKEENDQAGIEWLRERFTVWMSDVKTYEDALAMIQSVGLLTDKEEEASRLIHAIKHNIQGIRSSLSIRVLYLIWRDPWMGVGCDTFIHSMIRKAGFSNCLEPLQRYPQLTESQMQSYHPDYVFLSSEPFPFNETHIQELKRLLPDSKIVLVDGAAFSWYGSRMLYFADYINQLRIQLT
jgi:ABC-type Fe3+-hydroxamate transport system substrate-binding protein